MANIQFGTGTAVFNPSAINSPLLANVTPILPNLLQEMSVDFKASNKELYGRNQFAADVARGKITASGKGKMTATDATILNGLYFGLASTVGAQRPVTELHAVAASVVVTNGANFVKDYGVVNAATGDSLQFTSAAPTEGEYSVNVATGSYTFAAGETIASVNISYLWNDAVNGTTITLSSQAQGYGPEFEMNLYNEYRGKLFALRLFRCKMTDINIPSKMEDYWLSDFSYSICANDAGNIGVIYAD